MRVGDYGLDDDRSYFDGFLYRDEFRKFLNGQVAYKPGLISYCSEDF